MKHPLRATAHALAVLALLAAALPGAHAADAASLRLNWKMKGEFAPFVVAASKGYFQSAGIEAKVEEGSSATLALQAVATGQDDFAYVPSVQLIQAVNGGMPVKAVATVVKIDSMGMVARSGVSLKTPKDLEGKTVEIASASTFNNVWKSFAQSNGIDAAKVNVVSVDPGARFNLLLSGKVDVLADIFMTNELPVLKAMPAAKPMDTLTVGEHGFRIIGYTIVASDKTLAERPETVRKFLAAARQGFQHVLDHPDDAATVASAAYPEVLLPAATRGQVEALAAFLKQGEPTQLFAGSDAGWNATLDTLLKSGVIGAKKAPTAYYTNAFLPQ